jgi:hypothetical protein
MTAIRTSMHPPANVASTYWNRIENELLQSQVVP